MAADQTGTRLLDSAASTQASSMSFSALAFLLSKSLRKQQLDGFHRNLVT
jgi:hypothetical protein